MSTFLNFSYSNNLVRYTHGSKSSNKNTTYSLTPVNSFPYKNKIYINTYAVPFKARPLKHYRKRLIPTNSSSIRHVSLDTINSPDGSIKCNISKPCHPHSNLVNTYKWTNRL